MIEPDEFSYNRFNSPSDIMRTLVHLDGNIETYNESIELLRRLLRYVYVRVGGEESLLWDIKPKKLKAIKKYLDKVDEIIVGNK